MNKRGAALVGFILTVIFFFQSCKTDELTKTASIAALDCSKATFSATATSGVSFTATASIPYTGGNAAEYTQGTAVASTGVTGLTATLSAGTLANGSGTASFIITGTPSTAGTASFPIELGGQTCTLSLTIAQSQASISTFESTTTPAAGTSETAYTGTISMAYTGGNGGAYDASMVSSTGVEGLTATLTAGTLANGSGNLTYTIAGTPTSAGTAIFNISFGGQTGTLTISIAANTSGTANPAKDTVVIAYSGTSAAISNALPMTVSV